MGGSWTESRPRSLPSQIPAKDKEISPESLQGTHTLCMSPESLELGKGRNSDHPRIDFAKGAGGYTLFGPMNDSSFILFPLDCCVSPNC